MEDSEPSDGVEVKNLKSGLTLEPIMMLLCLGINANLTVQTNLFEERICLHSDLGQNKSVNCYNMTAADLEKVQPAVADLQMIKNLIETLVPCITALFLGSWSDVNGRLPLLLTAISGMVISNCMYSAFSTIPSLSPKMFLLCSIPVAVSGGYGALFMAASYYIVDITDCKTRAFRLGVLFAFVNFGSILGSVLSSILYGKSTTYSFCLSSFVSIVGLLYTYIFLKETIVIKEGTVTKLFSIKLVKDMWQTVTKQRFGYLRSIIILSAALLTLNLIILFGEDSFMYMYLQKQFLWTLENYTPFLVYTTLIHAIIPVIGLYVLNTKLQFPEMYIGITFAALGIFEKLGLGYSVHRWQFYAMKTVGYTVYISQPLVRSQLSKSLPSKDICKIFAFLNVIENFGVLLYSPMYTAVYVTTIHNFANCFFFFLQYLKRSYLFYSDKTDEVSNIKPKPKAFCRNLNRKFESEYKRQKTINWVNQTNFTENDNAGGCITLNGVDYNIEFSSDNIEIDEEISWVNNIINKPPTIHEVQTEDSIPQEISLSNIYQLDGTDSDNNSVILDINHIPETNNCDDISVIPGTPEPVTFNTSDDVINLSNDGNNTNIRKIRTSKVGDTRKYREYRKYKRDCGEEYITNNGKSVKARTSIILNDCRSQCKTKINENLQTTLFDIYWSLKSHDRQVSYISSLICVTSKITSRKRNSTPEKQKNRVCNFSYYIPKDKNLIKVCKTCFLKIFGITPKFVSLICTQKSSSPAHKVTPDKRGHSKPQNKKSPRVIQSVIDHINKLPSYESHYCRKETAKKYLPHHYTIQLAYDQYKQSVSEPVSRTLYQKYFKECGLKIKNPKKDTCSKCDSLTIQATNITCTEERKIELLNERKIHQDEAENAYETKRKDAGTTSNKVCVISFDLQQCLPTPSLESSVAFYKRQLWTFNLTVHNIKTSKASCYVWNESMAKRGGNDIGSCVFHFLSNLPPEIKHVIMYSDCCPGQNKNSLFMAMCLIFLEQVNTNIEVIDHKFMVSGHSRMECDSDHARIEKSKKRFSTSIFHPHDWAQLIRFAGKDKFTVIEIDQPYFLDFNSLLKTKYQLKKKMTKEKHSNFVTSNG